MNINTNFKNQALTNWILKIQNLVCTSNITLELKHFFRGNCNYPLTIEIQFFPERDSVTGGGKIFLKLIRCGGSRYIRVLDQDACHWLLDGVSVFSPLHLLYLSCHILYFKDNYGVSISF